MKKQSTLFPEPEVLILAELDLKDAERIANQVKTSVCAHCVKIEIAGSIRRQKPKVHDIDFVVTTKSDFEWQKISEELKRIKAKPNCQGSSIIKAFLPCQNGLFQVNFYLAKLQTFGILLLVRTGSTDHNVWLADCAISKGMRIKYSEGLIKDNNAIAGETEQGVFEALNLPYPLPSEREIVEGKPVWMPPEIITDESPLIRNSHVASTVLGVSEKTIRKIVHDSAVDAKVAKKLPNSWMYSVRTHSLRKFFRTQLSAAKIDDEIIKYMMGKTIDTYEDVQSLGIETLRNL